MGPREDNDAIAVLAKRYTSPAFGHITTRSPIQGGLDPIGPSLTWVFLKTVDLTKEQNVTVP